MGTCVSSNIKYSGADWSYDSCYSDSTSARTLPNLVTRPAASADWNQQTCLDAAKDAGYAVAGLEYGGECWGGNSLPDSNLETWGFLCTSCCNDGASGEACGGTNAIDIYISTSTVPVPVTVSSGPVKAVSTVFDYYGCFSDAVSARTLPNFVSRPSEDSEWTADSCLDAADAAGYEYAGVIYGGEWGADEIADTAVEQEASQCLWTCNDNKDEYCGGEGALDIYKRIAVVPTSDSSTTTDSATSTSTDSTVEPTDTTTSDSTNDPTASTSTDIASPTTEPSSESSTDSATDSTTTDAPSTTADAPAPTETESATTGTSSTTDESSSTDESAPTDESTSTDATPTDAESSSTSTDAPTSVETGSESTDASEPTETLERRSFHKVQRSHRA